MTVQHVEIEPGAVIETHSHPNEQAGFVYEGELVFLLDGEELRCRAGDAYSIPGGHAHGVENRASEPARAIDIFSPPRENPHWHE